MVFERSAPPDRWIIPATFLDALVLPLGHVAVERRRFGEVFGRETDMTKANKAGIEEFDAGNDFGDQFRAIESAPVLLGFHGKFKDHGKGSDS